jgi:hypothetical protein
LFNRLIGVKVEFQFVYHVEVGDICVFRGAAEPVDNSHFALGKESRVFLEEEVGLVPILAEVLRKRLGITQAVLIARNPDFFAFGGGTVRICGKMDCKSPLAVRSESEEGPKKLQKNKELREQEAGSAHLVSGWRGIFN